MDEMKYWLWLTMVFGIGSRRLWQFMERFDSAEEAYRVLTAGESDAHLTSKERQSVRTSSLETAEKLLAECERRGVMTVSFSSEEYPPQLRHISDPPAILYYRGDIRCLTRTKTITTVGARKALPYTLRVANRVCTELARRGVVIVSGFAVGVDITSHMAAAANGHPTAAVLGCGLDVDYPKENYRFRDAIVESGGVLVSEYPPGTPPHAQNFPKRNRILSALSRATVVFEASVKSGSLITASLAADQGRDVYCLPPADIYDPAYSGNALLLSEGASPFFSSDDIYSSFGYGMPLYTETADEVFGEENTQETPEPRRSAPAPEDKKEEPALSRSKKDEIKLEGVQADIAQILAEAPLHADIIAQKLGMDMSELMTELTEMEILGAVKSLPGKLYEKI